MANLAQITFENNIKFSILAKEKLSIDIHNSSFII